MIKSKSFYLQDGLTLARKLIGKYLVRKLNGYELKGKIVETEAYMGINDQGSHTYGGKRTERTKILYAEGGLVYVYSIYGIYYCLNIVANQESTPQAVFIRALEPINGISTMKKNRDKTNIKNLTNGPSKLCQALKIDKALYGYDLKKGGNLYLENGKVVENISSSPRINIDYAQEDKDRPWRFCESGNPFVSS